MSLNAMVDVKLARAIGSDPNQVSPPKPVGVETDIVNQLTRWIPTESITVYVAFLSLLAPQTVREGESVADFTYTSRWILVACVALATPVVVLLITKAKSDKWSWPIFEMIVGTLAFIVWAFALPDTPLSDLKGYNIKFNGAILVTFTVAISLFANAFKRSPVLDQSQTVAQGAVPKAD